MVALCRENCRQITETTAARPIRSVGVVGAGIMGTAIAIEHAAHSIPVVLMDKSPEALRRAAATAADELAAAQRGAGDESSLAAAHRLHPGRRRSWRLRPRAGIDRREAAGQAGRLRPDQTAPGRPRDPGHEHQHDSHRAAGRGHGRSGPILRTAFLPSRPAAPVGRGDSRSGDEPGNRGSGRGPCSPRWGSCRWSLPTAPALS